MKNIKNVKLSLLFFFGVSVVCIVIALVGIQLRDVENEMEVIEEEEFFQTIHQ